MSKGISHPDGEAVRFPVPLYALGDTAVGVNTQDPTERNVDDVKSAIGCAGNPFKEDVRNSAAPASPIRLDVLGFVLVAKLDQKFRLDHRRDRVKASHVAARDGRV